MSAPKKRRHLVIQRALGRLAFPFFAGGVIGACIVWGYRIDELTALRKKYRKICKQHKGPLLIAANHLTMIDSVLIIWALASNWSLFWNYRRMPWNVPEQQNFSQNIWLRTMCYVFKCVPIVREGSADDKREVLDQLEHLLNCGESVTIFPEGTRSRTGRLDTEGYGYGVGQLAAGVEDIAILCVYLRAHDQTGHTWLPSRGARIHADFRLIKPATTRTGLRAARDISRQTMGTLQDLEQEYFDQAPSVDYAEKANNSRQAAKVI